MSKSLTIASTRLETILNIVTQAVKDNIPFYYEFRIGHHACQNMHCITAQDKKGFDALDKIYVDQVASQIKRKK